jgi:hypothetical protein
VSGSYRQPPVPDPERPPDDTNEPLGYDLGDPPDYSQPPPPLLRAPDQPKRGSPPPGGYAWDPPPSGMATTGFVLGLLGVVGACGLPVISSPVPIVGIILSTVALVRIRRGAASGRGLAIAGVLLGIASLVLAVLVVWLLITMFPSDGF